MMRAGFREAVLLLGVAASLGIAAGARAADESAPDKGLAEAKDAFEAAQTAFVRGEYDDAAARFLEAYDKKPYPAFRQADRRLHRLVGRALPRLDRDRL
jgi:hypothetical protein